MGGLGKTSLAQFVYNHERVGREFPLKMWVCVSTDLNDESLLHEILASSKHKIKPPADDGNLNKDPDPMIVGQELPTTKQAYHGLSKDHLMGYLREALDGKKYLLVLDDVWDEMQKNSLELRDLLTKWGRGSKIIVTTRSKMVADAFRSDKILVLKGLSDKDSWNLFAKMAFEDSELQMKETFIQYVKAIIQKCAGVPLALRVVGSLLRGQRESRWQYFKSSDLTSIKEDDNDILSVLKISYYHLPFHLKSCFTYCATFPKDCRIMKDKLIQLWMAQALIIPRDGQSLEDMGEEYFMNLLQRCFFQDVEKDDSGEIISCKMHDLIHDIAKEVAGNEILSSNDNKSRINDKTRHFFIDENVETNDISEILNKMKRMRTVLNNGLSFYSFSREMKVVLSSNSLKNLRVLDLHDIRWETIPSTIGKLLHLRYLDLSNNRYIHVLPASITELYNLQTLNLRDCSSLKGLPNDLCKLVKLRHLDIYGCSGLTHMPPKMNQMTSLYKLTGFVMSESKNNRIWGPVGVGKPEDLKKFSNHADIMRIEVNKVRGWKNLLNNQQLKEVEIAWRGYYHGGNNNAVIELWKGLQSHHNLKKLTLSCYPDTRFTMNLKSCIPNIVEINLCACDMLEYLPAMSELKHLKVLMLRHLERLEYIESCNNSECAPTTSSKREKEVEFFASLEKLRLWSLPKLKGWWKTSSDGEQQQYQQWSTVGMNFESYSFIRLSHLNIENCPKLIMFPQCRKLEELKLKDFNRALGPLIRRDEADVGPLSSTGVNPDDASIVSNNREKQKLGSLKKVNITYARYLNSFPMECFHHHSHLTINFDEKLKNLATGREGKVFRSGCLSSLRSLEIEFCKNLRRVSGKGVWDRLTSLETLKLISLDELELEDEEDVNSINTRGGRWGEGDEITQMTFLPPSLRSLELCLLPKLVKLPKGMRHLTSLHSLEIRNCENLEALPTWIACLTSLQSLSISCCPKLKSLPQEIHGLTSLQQLRIHITSEQLLERCRKPTGADWPNIQHIPNVDIL